MATISGPITADGALVTIAVGVSEARRRLLQRHNLPVPLPSQVRVVLDPASSFTLADERGAIGSLGVTSYRQQLLLSSASGVTFNSLPVYDLSVALLDDTGNHLVYWPQVDVLGTSYPPNAAVRGVFGRDLLADCVFHFDGKKKTFSLTV
jgi:hypothetical protein